jgi:hypothetical protein
LDIQHELTVEGIERRKVDYTEDELKQLTVAHIAKHYPTPEWVHMYTDGSATPDKGTKEMLDQEFIQIYFNKPGQQEKTEVTTMEKSKQSRRHLSR